MQKFVMMLLAVVTVSFMTPELVAAEKKPKKEKKAPAKKAPAKKLTEFELSGKLVKRDVTRKGKDGEEKTYSGYALETDDGEVLLPRSVEKATGFDGSLDKQVTVSASGTEKDGKKRVVKVSAVTAD